MNKALIVVKGLEPLACAIAALMVKSDIAPTLLIDNINQAGELIEPFASVKKFDISNENDIEKFDFQGQGVAFVFIVVGVFLEKQLLDVNDDEIKIIYDAHFLNPIRFLRKLYQENKKPCHLVIVGSCSAWRLQNYQSIYTSIRAAQATFARNLTSELAEDIPGSKVSLLNLAGIKTPELTGKTFGSDDQFMDPEIVAETVLKQVLNQKTVYSEWQIMRKKPVVPKSIPLITEGPETPQIFVENNK